MPRRPARYSYAYAAVPPIVDAASSSPSLANVGRPPGTSTRPSRSSVFIAPPVAASYQSRVAAVVERVQGPLQPAGIAAREHRPIRLVERRQQRLVGRDLVQRADGHRQLAGGFPA